MSISLYKPIVYAIALFKMFLRCFFANNKSNYHVQNVKVWRCNVECADLISTCNI